MHAHMDVIINFIQDTLTIYFMTLSLTTDNMSLKHLQIIIWIREKVILTVKLKPKKNSIISESKLKLIPVLPTLWKKDKLSFVWL